MSIHQGSSNLPVKSLLQLPVEIQTQIYYQYYAEPWTFYAQDYHFNALEPRGEPFNPSTSNPSINLLLTCRAINKIASPMLLAFYNNVVSLAAAEKFNEYREWDVFLSTCQSFIAPATKFYIRLDQGPHFSAWGLLDELQKMEAQNFKTVVMEDHFIVKQKRSVFRKHNKRRIPSRFVDKVAEGRYLTAEPWGVDTWRRDYNSRHLRYPMHHRYLLRFRVDQPELYNKIFEVEMELTTVGWDMDLPWKQWLVLREDVFDVSSYGKDWEVLDLDHLPGHDNFGYDTLPPIVGALDIELK